MTVAAVVRQRTGREALRRLYRSRTGEGRALGELLGGRLEGVSQGAWITTDAGGRFLDCGGLGIPLTGARHPTVLRHVREQLEHRPVASGHCPEPQSALAADALLSVAPPGLERVHFTGSAVQALTPAARMARARGRTRLVSLTGSRHGLLLDELTPGDSSTVPYGDAAALRRVLADAAGRACVFVEPLQDEAGVALPPPGRLRAVAALCREYGALLALDETATGLGRLGAWWGAGIEEVAPDLLVVGGALGAGVVPLAAVVATAGVSAAFDHAPCPDPYPCSGAPLAMAAARGALAALREDNLVGRARVLGEEILRVGGRIVRGHYGPEVREVRGRGLLLGIEFTGPKAATGLLIELVRRGVITGRAPRAPHVLRLAPPAVLTRADLDHLYEALDRSCRARAGRRRRR
ncbi:hypothetical protein A8W25_27115 [Streptomyces sp. ERV7]|uniref:aminotransferase class III-fold pyridoxal phosphate-dependent enzyme n=1 Tax=Streptomyces sp. ERV7 TaxID=1322334 RepID=UPI0007F4665B|nr:aminotransferase class III-fold pyridoxal phosphate-dependent enzyme [Streptomyces sp. ERV7]OAR23176.1 hypothetical protein A8W25_27115 [Streptomyces sp. ERV7]